jgi:hypothetical protein
MGKVVFKQPLWARIVDILMYLFGLGFVVVLSYFALQHFFGLEGVYGIPTVYLTAVIGVIIFLLMAKSVISDAKLRVEVENKQITIIDGKNPQVFDIETSGFTFESKIYSGDSQHFLTITDPNGQNHGFDISGLGQIEVEELKALISSIQKPAPNKIQTQED